MAADHIGQRGGRALIGDVDELDIGEASEQLAGDVADGADPGRGVIDGAGLGLGECIRSLSECAGKSG